MSLPSVWKLTALAIGGILVSFLYYNWRKNHSSTYHGLIRQAQRDSAKKLNLDSQGIFKIDSEIESLSSLEYLSLKMNRITEASFEKQGKFISFSGLSKLRSLELRDNLLKSLPKSFATFPPSFRILNLSANEIQELDPNVLKSLKVSKLHLQCNMLTQLPHEIQSLANIRVLDLSFNKLTLLPDSIATLHSLEDLRLSANRLTKLPENIGNLQNLKIFEISANFLTEIPVSFSKLSKLERLALGDNQLTNLPKGLQKLVNLVNLTCYSNKIESLPNKIGNLKNLKSLHCQQNQLKCLPPSFYDLEGLQSLNLAHNALTDISPKIGQLLNLQDFNLCGNNLMAIPEEMNQLGNCVVELRENYKLHTIPPSVENHKTLSLLTSLPTEVIEKKLYVGGWESATNKEGLKFRNITHILQLANTNTTLYPSDFTYWVLDIKDKSSEDITKHFDTTNKYIDKVMKDDNSAILIHCMMGVSRSPSIVIAYLMYSQQWTYQEAFEFLKSKRRFISPNMGFERQLQEYEKERFFRGK